MCVMNYVDARREQILPSDLASMATFLSARQAADPNSGASLS